MNVRKHDLLERRCPRLGGVVTFRYCMGADEKGKPCHAVIDCWWERFDVGSYLKTHLDPEDVETLMHRRPIDKVSSLMDLVQKTRERISGK